MTSAKKQRKLPLVRVAMLLLLGAIAVKQVRAWWLPHDAILVLGGSPSREQFAAEFAQRYPNLPVWISSGSNPEYVEWVFSEAGIDRDRLHLDYRAVDTVTNFTTLVDDFRQKGIQKPYVITSDYHMRRARVIGAIVFGSRGIEFQPVAIPSEQVPESWSKAARDAARAILWVTTGNTGAEFADYLTNQPR